MTRTVAQIADGDIAPARQLALRAATIAAQRLNTDGVVSGIGAGAIMILVGRAYTLRP